MKKIDWNIVTLVLFGLVTLGLLVWVVVLAINGEGGELSPTMKNTLLTLRILHSVK